MGRTWQIFRPTQSDTFMSNFITLRSQLSHYGSGEPDWLHGKNSLIWWMSLVSLFIIILFLSLRLSSGESTRQIYRDVFLSSRLTATSTIAHVRTSLVQIAAIYYWLRLYGWSRTASNAKFYESPFFHWLCSSNIFFFLDNLINQLIIFSRISFFWNEKSKNQLRMKSKRNGDG